MGSKTSSSVKVKVTASLDAGLVKAMDDYLKESETRSRSKLIEDILHYWHKEQKPDASLRCYAASIESVVSCRSLGPMFVG